MNPELSTKTFQKNQLFSDQNAALENALCAILLFRTLQAEKRVISFFSSGFGNFKRSKVFRNLYFLG
jgi:hypothetical protein